MTKSRKHRILLETSAVIYQLHGERRLRAAVAEATSDGRIEVSNFIRMEYLRGVIVKLIEFYFLIKESDSVADALIDWSQKFKIREIKVVMMSAANWLVDHEGHQSKQKSLRRLGDGIVRLVYRFDDFLNRRSKDHLRCELGRTSFRHQSFNEDMLLEFYERFRGVQTSVPGCNLCGFKERQRRSLLRRGIDLYGQNQRDAYKSNKGFVKQAERLEELENISNEAPRCRWCERLGDSIIALHAPDRAVLVTADKAFQAFGDLLEREVRLLPSLANLKRQHEEDTSGD